MPKCSVIGCVAKKNANHESLSLHRLPKSEYKKTKWLEALGIENLTTNLKDIFICSLHFPENAFNKTLDVIRLKDEAIPSLSYQLPVKSKIAISATQPVPGTSGVGSLMIPVESTICTIPTQLIPGTAEVSLPVKSKIAIIATQPVPGTSRVGSLMLPVESTISTIPTQPIPGTAEVSEPMKVKKLERQVVCLRRKVKSLNEKVRRQKKKLANYESIIMDLQERDLVNNAIVLEACARQKYVIKKVNFKK